MLSIFNQIIDSYAATPERGLPIGNLTSQYFANHFLSPLDHFINDTSKCAYVRYMDDMVLWHDDKAVLLENRGLITEFVENELLCTLKPEQLNFTSKGLSFLGYQIFPKQMRLTQQSKQRFIRKANTVDRHFDDGSWSETKCQRRMLPLLAFVQHGDTEGFRKHFFYKR